MDESGERKIEKIKPGMAGSQVPQVKAEIEIENDIRAEVEAGAEVRTGTRAETEPEAGTGIEAEVRAEAAIGMGAEAEVKAGVATGTGIEAEVKAATGTGIEAEVKAETGTVAEDKPASDEVKPPKKKKKKKKKVKPKKILPPKVICVENVGVRFNLNEEKVDNLKEYFIKLLKRELRFKEFWALKEVSFNVRLGDRMGILGLNGAGKSTLLKVIAGVLKTTEGRVETKGNIVPLLELGAGFDRDYTGAENIFLYGAMLGYSRPFLKERFDEIVEFSELGEFINVPLKNYSSGMKARLGFAIATIVEPEILILDEVLSVGDAKFRKKSEKKIKSILEKGATVLFVSHSTDQVLGICNKAIILDKGKLVAKGSAKKVCKIYEEQMIGQTGKPAKKKPKKKVEKQEAVGEDESVRHGGNNEE